MPALDDEEEIYVAIWAFRIGFWMRHQAGLRFELFTVKSKKGSAHLASDQKPEAI